MATNTRTRLARPVLVAALTTLLAITSALWAAPSASALQTGVRGDYFQPPTPYQDSGTFDPECEKVDVTVHYRVRGVDSLRNVPGSDGEAFLLEDSYRFQDVWKKAGSKRVLFTQRGHYRFREVSATPVRKADVPRELVPAEGLVGPIYRFKAVEVGHDTVRSASGKLLFLTAGKLVFSNLFDTLGDSAPGGTSLDFRTVKVAGPHPLLEVDLCDVAAKQARKLARR
jgi:hypothetical protein